MNDKIKMALLAMSIPTVPNDYFADYLEALFKMKEKGEMPFPDDKPFNMDDWSDFHDPLADWRGPAEFSDPTDPVHYSRWEIEPLEFITRNKLDFLRGNIIKYIMRYDMKGGVEDLKKARVYLDKLIESAENGEKSL